ncbi:MAG: hypothetical protein M3323_12470 [Actinomycetota bacterium]|nr:hypothetical protein [Actinomycetota bacterium]
MRDLLPPLIEITGNINGQGPPNPDFWTLSSETGEMLAHDDTLEGGGILDGHVLHLDRTGPRETPSATFVPLLADDHLTPSQRTARALPEYLPAKRRIALTVRALFGRTEEAPPRPRETSEGLDEATPRSFAVPRRAGALDRANAAWNASNYVNRLSGSIRSPSLRRCATIAVISPKGGVGKTTVTALLGSALSLLRHDGIFAIDTDSASGALASVLVPDHQLFVDDLGARFEERNLAVTEVTALFGSTSDGLRVLGAPRDGGRRSRLDTEAYLKILMRMKDYAGVLLLDCGKGLHNPFEAAAIEAADQLVLVTDAEPTAASLVANAGPEVLETARPVTIVVNEVSGKRSPLDVDKLALHIPSARGVVVFPNEPKAAARIVLGEFSWGRPAPKTWRRSAAELGTVLVKDWSRLGLTL